MNGWFLALVIIGAMEIGGNMVMHGERKTGKYNFFSTTIVWLLIFWLIVEAIKTGF